MANMSYCRFENTYSDFQDCITAIEEEDELSSTEETYMLKLRDLAQEYIDLTEHLQVEE